MAGASVRAPLNATPHAPIAHELVPRGERGKGGGTGVGDPLVEGGKGGEEDGESSVLREDGAEEGAVDG